MRAEKRKKNAPKELERLKKILGTNADVIMEEVKEVATVLPAKKVLEQGGELGSRWAALELRGGPRWQTRPGPAGGRGARAGCHAGPGLPQTCLSSARLSFPPVPLSPPPPVTVLALFSL